MATIPGSQRLLDISGNNISTAVSLEASGTLLDVNGVAGTSGQVLSSTGSAVDWVDASTVIGGPYLPLTAGGSYPLTGDLNLTYAYPRINLTDTNNDSDYSIINNDGTFSIYDVTNNSQRLTISAAGNATFAGAVNADLGIVASGAMSTFETTLTNNDDWQNSPISINERGNVGSAQTADKYAPNLNFHWGGIVSNSLWLSSNGHLNYGSYSSTGIPASDGRINAATFYGDHLGTINTATTGVTQTAGNNSTLIATTAYADAAAGAVPIGNYLPLVGGTMTGTNGVLFPDNFKLKIGTGSDLQIYHDGSDSYIDDTGTGWLRLRGNGGVILSSYSEGETMLQATRNGAVELYYDNSKKFETTSTGVTVTGGGIFTGDVSGVAGTFTGNLAVGTASSAEIYLNRNSANYINAANATGYLVFRTAGAVTALTLSAAQNATFAGNVVIGSVDSVVTGLNIGEASPTIQLFDTTNDGKLLMYMQDSSAVIGTYSNHSLNLFTNSTLAVGIDTSQNATFAGNVDIDGGTLNVGSSNQVNIVASGSSLFPSLKVNNNGYLGSASVLTQIQLLSSGNTIFIGTVTAPTFIGDLNGTINTATTAVTKANATNDTTVATTAFVQNLIGTIPAGLVFQGTWNAATNTPTLTSGSGTTGHFYIVSTSGSTNLDGVTDWVTGDWDCIYRARCNRCLAKN
jgi:hypothetical protein